MIKRLLAKIEIAIHNAPFMKIDERKSFETVAEQYGVVFARRLEQLYRLETAHFKSGGYINAKSAGVVVQSSQRGGQFPWGWSTLEKFAQRIPMGAEHFEVVKESNGFHYVKFPSTHIGIMFTAYFIHNVRNNDFGHWYRNPNVDPAGHASYLRKLDSINPQFN